MLQKFTIIPDNVEQLKMSATDSMNMSRMSASLSPSSLKQAVLGSPLQQGITTTTTRSTPGTTSPIATNEDAGLGMTIRGRLPPTEFPLAVISCCTKLGKRKKQEDRCVIVPRVSGNDAVAFLGVFDGTVGDHAAEYVHATIADNVCNSKPFKTGVNIASGSGNNFLQQKVIEDMETSLLQGYQNTDAGLLAMCAEKCIDYSACTSVTCVIAGPLLTCAHLGDSKIVLGREENGTVCGKNLTRDHKPDQPEERKRIESCGGSLAYLHGGKPFIRGGDFTERQAKGDRPMQLNYSRAFGGKDLKMFGLLAVPDILQLKLGPEDKLIILASDGLWDVVGADAAVKRAWESIRLGRDPALDLTDFALAQHDIKGSIDNVTVIVVNLKH